MGPWLDLIAVTAVQTLTAILTVLGFGLIAVFALDRLVRLGGAGRRRRSRRDLPPVQDEDAP
jgi:hypothetical protein